MDAQEIIRYIAAAEKKTPVKLYIRENAAVDYGSAQVFGVGDKIVFGDWRELGPIIEANRDSIADIVIESDRLAAFALLPEGLCKLPQLPARDRNAVIVFDRFQ